VTCSLYKVQALWDHVFVLNNPRTTAWTWNRDWLAYFWLFSNSSFTFSHDLRSILLLYSKPKLKYFTFVLLYTKLPARKYRKQRNFTFECHLFESFWKETFRLFLHHYSLWGWKSYFLKKFWPPMTYLSAEILSMGHGCKCGGGKVRKCTHRLYHKGDPNFLLACAPSKRFMYKLYRHKLYRHNLYRHKLYRHKLYREQIISWTNCIRNILYQEQIVSGTNCIGSLSFFYPFILFLKHRIPNQKIPYHKKFLIVNNRHWGFLQ
jgi:hypothetical protein